MGFGTGQGMSRDDLSNVIQVGRFRHHLEMEKKQERGITEGIMAEAHRLAEAERTRPRGAASFGLSTVIPKFASAYDRANFVDEFHAKAPVKLSEVKAEKYYGALRPTSADVGDGCAARHVLTTPVFGVKQVRRAVPRAPPSRWG